MERETHTFNVTSLAGPWNGFTLSAGVLNEWSHQEGFGHGAKDLIFPSGFILPNPVAFNANLDQVTVEESATLRYTSIPFTALFAEARLRQEGIGQSEQETGGPEPFLRDTDADTNLRDLRFGFNTSPWRIVSWTAQYRLYYSKTDYNHVLDESPFGDGYPAFIRRRQADTDEAQTKLAVNPCNWLKASLTYAYERTRYKTATDSVSLSSPGDISPGGSLDSANYSGHTVGLNATLIPWRRWTLSGTFSGQNTRMVAFNNNDPAVAPYRGNTFNVLSSAAFAVDPKTEWRTSYSFSWADYAQNNFADGLPLGIFYRRHALTTGLSRHFSKNVSARLQYGFYRYQEPSSGAVPDYTAHAVFGMLMVALP